jgi:hypothetical protein
VSLFGERERAAKCPGRREACERARRCARRTRGEGERSTDVLRVHQEELQLGLLVSEFERRRVTFRRRERGRAWRHAHRSPRGRAARGEFPPWTVLFVSHPSGRTAPVEHTRRRVSDVARTSPDRLKVHTKRNHGACTAAGHASAAAGSRRDSRDRDASLRHERARIVQTSASIERHPHASLPARARDDVGLLREARHRSIGLRGEPCDSVPRFFFTISSSSSIETLTKPQTPPLLRRPATAACTSLCSPRWTKS